MRFRLILEELSPELIYNKGSTNIVADALSYLDKIDNLNTCIYHCNWESTGHKIKNNFAYTLSYTKRKIRYEFKKSY